MKKNNEKNNNKGDIAVDSPLKKKIDLKKADQVLEKLKKIDSLIWVALTTGATDIDVDFFTIYPLKILQRMLQSTDRKIPQNEAPRSSAGTRYEGKIASYQWCQARPFYALVNLGAAGRNDNGFVSTR